MVSDTVMAVQCRVTRQTVLAARRRLKIGSRREHVRATRGARSKSISLPLSERECRALDQAAKKAHMSRSDFLGRLLLHPQLPLLLRPGAEVIIRIASEAWDDADAI